MSKEKGPPRPGARPRPTGRSPSGVHRAARPTAKRAAPDEVPSPPKPEASPPEAPSGEALEMIPLGQDTPVDPGGDGATTFFARPKPKGASASGERPAEPALKGYRPPIAGGGPPPAAPPAAGIPMGRPPMGGPAMGIQGPVASGPIASGPTVSTKSDVAGPTSQVNTQRARSFRLYAFVLLICTGLAGSLVVGFAMIFMYSQSNNSEQQLAEVAPKPTPKKRNRGTVDTATPKKAAPAPVPARPARPAPRPSVARPSAPAPRPASSPAPAPAPAPKPAPVATAAAGQVTLKFASPPSFLKAEMRCPGGGRQRKSFSGTRVTFDNVAASGCTVTFKGGAAHAPIELTGGRDMTCSESAGLPDCR